MGGKGKMRALGNGYEWEDVEYVKGRQVINIHEESGIRGAGWDDWGGFGQGLERALGPCSLCVWAAP